MAGGGVETYLTIAELAEYIKLSEQTVRRYVLNKTVPYRKIHKAVRFRVSEIEKWIDGGGLDGAVKAGPGDDRERDLFAGLEADSGVTEQAGEPAADAAETGEAAKGTGIAETETAATGEEGTGADRQTGGAAEEGSGEVKA
jgi:excisionase family DNA binding protein